MRSVDLCAASGILPILVTQPTLGGGGVDPLTHVNLDTIQVGSTNQDGLLAWQILELYNQVTRDVAKKRGIEWVDLAHRLPKRSEDFYDFYHFTNAGAQNVGTILAQALTPYLSSKFPSYVKRGRNAFQTVCPGSRERCIFCPHPSYFFFSELPAFQNDSVFYYVPTIQVASGHGLTNPVCRAVARMTPKE